MSQIRSIAEKSFESALVWLSGIWIRRPGQNRQKLPIFLISHFPQAHLINTDRALYLLIFG